MIEKISEIKGGKKVKEFHVFHQRRHVGDTLRLQLQQRRVTNKTYSYFIIIFRIREGKCLSIVKFSRSVTILIILFVLRRLYPGTKKYHGSM